MATSFATDVRPLFRAKDVSCMERHGVLLDSFEYMSNPAADALHEDHGNARSVLDRISGRILPRMPLGAPAWPEEQILLFGQWIEEGCPP